jgi:hypothetical protein
LLDPTWISIEADPKFTAKVRKDIQAVTDERLAAWEREKARRRAAAADGTQATGT